MRRETKEKSHIYTLENYFHVSKLIYFSCLFNKCIKFIMYVTYVYIFLAISWKFGLQSLPHILLRMCVC